MEPRLIIAGTLLLPDTAGELPGVRLSEGWFRTDGGRIVEIHEGGLPASFDLGGDGYLISRALSTRTCTCRSST